MFVMDVWTVNVYRCEPLEFHWPLAANCHLNDPAVTAKVPVFGCRFEREIDRCGIITRW